MKKPFVFIVLILGPWVLAAQDSGTAPDAVPLERWPAAPFWTPADAQIPSTLDAGGAEVQKPLRPPLALVSIEPCRLIDTRAMGAFAFATSEGFGAPSLLATSSSAPLSLDRVFKAGGGPPCGLPAGVRAISVKLSVLNYAVDGVVTVYAEGLPDRPTVPTLAYHMPPKIATTEFVLPLSADGKFGVYTSETTDLVVDVNGYYLQQTGVTSLNGLEGDVTLAAGADLVLTPSGQTLTYSANSASDNTPSTLVRRDAAGDFSAGQITGNLTGNVSGSASLNVLKTGDLMTGTLAFGGGNVDLGIEPSTPFGGSIVKSGIPFLHDFGFSNTFVGLGAGNFTMGPGGGASYLSGYNSVLGANALQSNTTGFGNVAIGASAMFRNSTGQQNAAVGFGSMFGNLSGRWNVALGYTTLYANTSGFSNVAIGLQSMLMNTVGAWNVGVGVGTLQGNVDGISNTAVGAQVLYMNTDGGQNTGIGDSALFYNTTGHFNAAIGDAACESNTTGQSNSCIGHATLYLNSTGSFNTAVGENALYQNNASGNTATGAYAMNGTVTGTNNVANGYYALAANVAGSSNVALGYGALNGESNHGTAVGTYALGMNVSGNENTAVGSVALYDNTTGRDNTAVGVAAGWTNVTGGANTFIGMFADAASGDLNNVTALGAGAKVATNNTVVLGSSAVTDVLAGTNGQAVVHGASFMPASAELPPAGPAYAGQIRYVAGGPGVKDQVVVCAKDKTDAWAWRVLY